MARGAPPRIDWEQRWNSPHIIQYVHLCPLAFYHYSSWQVGCHPSSPSWILRGPMANLLKSAFHKIRDKSYKKAPSGGIEAPATIIFPPWSRSSNPTPPEQDGICVRQLSPSSVLKPFFKSEITTSSSWRRLHHAAHKIHPRHRPGMPFPSPTEELVQRRR